ncbi:site-specific integrase [Gemmata sp. G18]|uniref:Site-specific integrase n=1 Tax=Gemmata palustris TaxID=2822762 RepID=A0ABS5BU07_9BACT|nr:site-specific integrase [Gemmata palustris]MBP3957173.1 site-specific integrase [Gemmata palustris]
MSARRKPTPSYLLHKQSERARAVWTDSTGTRQQKLLPGLFDSPESRSAFARLLLELEVAPHARTNPDGATVNEVLLAFITFAETHYRRADGTTTNELDEYKLVSRHVRELYGDRPAAEFGPLALKALRQRFIGAGWARGFINQRVGRVRRVFKWAASEELVPATVYHALATVAGLQRGRSAARESEPVGPVAGAVVDATLPFLNRHVRGLIECQRLTGCRPGEACAIRRSEIDTTGPIWFYKPPQHKTAWRGNDRTIAIGPKAQELLQQFFTPDAADYLFSPARAVEELRAARGANRKTPRYPSHMARNAAKRKARPKRAPAHRYTRGSYGVAIDRACDKAFPPAEPLAPRPGEFTKAWWVRLTADERATVKAWQKAHRWHPNQLRHLFATEVRKGHGLEAAQVLLGHSRADVTQVYAERNEALAATVAAKIG